MKDYDKTVVYNNQIFPRIQEIKKICNENKIPFFASFGVKLEDGKYRAGNGLVSSFILPEILKIEHNDPCFSGFVNVVNGADTVYPEISRTEEIDADSEYF